MFVQTQWGTLAVAWQPQLEARHAEGSRYGCIVRVVMRIALWATGRCRFGILGSDTIRQGNVLQQHYMLRVPRCLPGGLLPRLTLLHDSARCSPRELLPRLASFIYIQQTMRRSSLVALTSHCGNASCNRARAGNDGTLGEHACGGRRGGLLSHVIWV